MRLVLRFDGQDVQEFVLDKNDITIGRTPNNDIAIDNLAISSHHATVHLNGTGAELIDMKSTNGTFVNDKKIVRQTLQDGDIIGIGKHQLLFFSGSAFSASGSDEQSDEQSEATVMMSADFQKQLQEELSKNQAVTRTVQTKEKKGFLQKIKELFGLS